MKKNILFLAILIFSLDLFSQNETDILATINSESVLVKDFKRIYEKNLNAIDNKEAKDVEKNLNLFINFKLKVKEAYQLNLDTISSYKREIKMYKLLPIFLIKVISTLLLKKLIKGPKLKLELVIFL